MDSFLLTTALSLGFLALLFALANGAPSRMDRLMDDPAVALSTQVGFLALYVGYGTFFEASPWRGTPGKLLFGLEVVDVLDRPLDVRSALTRNLVKMFLLSFCSILALTAFAGQGLWNEQSGHRVVLRRR